MLIYVKIIKKMSLPLIQINGKCEVLKIFFFYLCLFYDNFMLIYVKKKKKKKFFIGRTDTRSTQNYSSEPHKIKNKLC